MKIKRYFRHDIEPQEVFLDRLAKEHEEELGISERRFETPLSGRVLYGLWFSFLALSCLLFFKTFQLQVLQAKEMREQARANQFVISSVQATRGIIYDRNLEQLVFNKPTFDLILERAKLPNEDAERVKVFQQVCETLKIDCAVLKEAFGKSGGTEFLAAENLPHETVVALGTMAEQLPGFRLQRNAVREYKEGEIASHLIGYTAKINEDELKTLGADYSITDIVGRDGLEKSYEPTLARQPGKVRIERDALGNVLSKEIIALPEPGKNIVLELDFDLQREVALELERVIKEVKSAKGAAVMLDPRNGAVLALASFPRFDNNLFSTGADAKAIKQIFDDPKQPLFDRAIAGQYPPGSTIKPLIASAALQEKLISPDKSVDCQGLIEVPNQYDRTISYQFRDWATHGLTALRKAIAVSCNVYFYTIGGGYGNQPGLGPTRIKKYLELFGWGGSTRIDLPGEKPGFIPDKNWKETVKKEPWWDGDTYHFSIGQGDLLVTPLQVAAAFSAIANGGTIYQSRVVQKIVDEDKETIEETKPIVIRQVAVDQENLQIVREGMRESVLYGSASKWLNGLPVKVAAKTGTAQTAKTERYQNWVTVFAPYENPEVVLAVVVEEVAGLQAAALPIAQGILYWYFTQNR